jgi:ABC-2 type transport system permease protein
MNHSVLLAIFKRNFVSYFLNPTGYVFICVFVLLSSLAAFWPDEFFSANLANLDQLNRYFPLIMLVFVPAITMSIWAEERRQGTDELLLTIPATDFDVVMGKYLASVAIYAASLMFSLVCNFIILSNLGEPDLGLFFSTYLGYFMVGLAMLSIGMVASFLTSNITVGFVLGAVFCAIPVGLDYVETILPQQAAMKVRGFGIAKQLLDFTFGVCSLSSMAYFTSIVVIMLYLSIVLIGRRHWIGGRDGKSMGPHYLVRILSLTATAVGIVLLTTVYTVRADLTAESLNSLSPKTTEIVAKLDSKKPIHIEAFISPAPPREMVPLRNDLVRQLREIAARGGANVTLRINDTLPYTTEADRAEKVYGITGTEIRTEVRGKFQNEIVFLGLAISSGLDKIVIPFVSQNTPIEYEIVRSISTLNGEKRMRLGLFVGDKTAFQEPDGGRDQSGRPTMGDPQIVTELRKQYDVVELDAEKPVPDDINVLVAIQPTAMRLAHIDNLVAAIRRGVPTLLFQDPLPAGFDQLRQLELQINGGMSHVQEAETQKLWDLLGIETGGTQVVTQDYNPIPWLGELPPTFVFAAEGALGKNPENASVFDEGDPISSKTQALLFLFGGWVAKKDSDLKFSTLVRTSKSSGYVTIRDEVLTPSFSGMLVPNFDPPIDKTGKEYPLIARIRGTPKPLLSAASATKALSDVPATTDGASSPKGLEKNELLLAQAPAASSTATAAAPAASASPTATAAPTASAKPTVIVNPYVVPTPTATATSTAAATPSATAAGSASVSTSTAPKEIDVVVIADLDFIGGEIFRLRRQRESSSDDVVKQLPSFDNVTLVLNALDELAGDARFIEVRKHRSRYRTLTTLEEISNQATYERNKKKKSRKEQLQKEVDDERALFEAELKKLDEDRSLKLMDKRSQMSMFRAEQGERLRSKQEQINLSLAKEVKELERAQNEDIRKTEDLYKAIAVFVPPIFPLLIGLFVFFSRRAGEQEGVDRKRLL